MKSFLSSDGHAVRFITAQGDHNREGIKSIDAIRTHGRGIAQGLETLGIYRPARRQDLRHLWGRPMGQLLIAGQFRPLSHFYHHADHHTGPYCRRRHCGHSRTGVASFGLSVLLWQHILSICIGSLARCRSSFCWRWDLTTICAPVSRFKHEIGRLKTGIIGRWAAPAGRDNAVFAVTMASMAVSDLRVQWAPPSVWVCSTLIVRRS